MYYVLWSTWHRSSEEMKCFRVAYSFQRSSTKIRILKDTVIQKWTVLMKTLKSTESCYSDKARTSSSLLCRNTEVMWNCAQKKKSLNSYPKTCSSILKMLQLIKHSLSKVFMAKHLLMDFKTSLFTKFGLHWLLALYKIEIHIERTKISGH